MGISNERLAELWVYRYTQPTPFNRRNKRMGTTIYYQDDLVYLSHCNTPMAKIFTPEGKNPFVVIARYLPEHVGSARSSVARGADQALHGGRSYWNDDRKDIYYVGNIHEPDWRAEIEHILTYEAWRRHRASKVRDRHNLQHQIAWSSKLIAKAQRISETFNVHVPGLYGPDI